ncbi:MAG TPA: hypothetical protein PLE45_03600 [Spirochaetota bacterium]|nr:hypothetical protein [Spirochaetota bacterium]HOL56335.1 hypothetical protein [Spirochaetota bacterium]HPP03548.1 hypothetical protein [Spirochaetota bacterium]
MKKIIFLVMFVSIFRIYGEGSILHNFNFVCCLGVNIAFYYYDEPYKYKEVFPIYYIENILGFDYIFIKKINDKYGVGFVSGIKDIIGISGILIDYITGYLYTFPYFFINRINWKIGVVNLLEIGSVNFLEIEVKKSHNILIESAINISFVSFWASYNNYSTYYITFWIGPYIFVGYYNKIWGIEIEPTHTVGMFFQLDFDIGKYIGEYQNSIQPKEPYPFETFKVFDTDMQFVHCYFSFGVEYRVGRSIEKK